jgi:hypothetical protein
LGKAGDEMNIILLCLLSKHFLADFVLQTSAMAKAKGRYGNLMGISHAATHGVLTTLVLLFFCPPWVAIGLGAADALVHYHIDWLKVRFGEKDSSKPVYWYQFGADQLAHQITYFCLVMVL